MRESTDQNNSEYRHFSRSEIHKEAVSKSRSLRKKKNSNLDKLCEPEILSDKVISDKDFTDEPKFNVMFQNGLIHLLTPRVHVF